MRRALLTIFCVFAVAAMLNARGSRASETPAAQSRGGSAVLDMYINFTWFGSDRWSGIIPEEITRRTGVTFNVTRAVDEGQLGMMIASGDLPDIVFTADELGRLANKNISWGYNELIAQYGLQWAPDAIRITNAKLYNQPGDDNYYFLLNSFSTADEWKSAKALGNEPSIGVRQDILDALGNPAINTLADFDRVLGMVKQQYPGIVPYTAGATSSWGNKALRVWNGVSGDAFADEDGTIKYYINSKNYRNYLQYVNQLYRKGYIMADNYSYTDSDVKALFTNGQTFSLSHCTSGEIYTFGEMAKAVDPNAYAREIAILGSDTKYYITDAGWAGVVIPRKSRNPEAAIKFMQFMWTEEGRRLSQWGREGVEYTMGGNGLPVFTQEWLDATKDSNVMYAKYNNLYWMTTNSAWLTQSIAATIPEPFLATYRSVLPHLYICPWLGAATPKAEGPEKNILIKLNDMVTNAEVKCFLAENDAEFDQYYNELMSNARTIGVDQLETYMNQQISKYRAMYQ